MSTEGALTAQRNTRSCKAQREKNDLGAQFLFFRVPTKLPLPTPGRGSESGLPFTAKCAPTKARKKHHDASTVGDGQYGNPSLTGGGGGGSARAKFPALYTPTAYWLYCFLLGKIRMRAPLLRWEMGGSFRASLHPISTSPESLIANAQRAAKCRSLFTAHHSRRRRR